MEFAAFLFIILMASLFYLAIIVIPAFMMKRAVEQVVSILRTHHANEPSTAKSVGDLGLSPLGFLDRIGRTRDYKPIALNFLLRAGVIKETAEDRVYLSEGKLKNFCERHTGSKPDFCEQGAPTSS